MSISCRITLQITCYQENFSCNSQEKKPDNYLFDSKFRKKLGSNQQKYWTTKVQRLRAQALWSLIIGGIGLTASALGLIQYWLYGVVSIRPGHQPVSGSDAVEMIIYLSSASALFCAYGIILRYRARREPRL